MITGIHRLSAIFLLAASAYSSFGAAGQGSLIDVAQSSDKLDYVTRVTAPLHWMCEVGDQPAVDSGFTITMMPYDGYRSVARLTTFRMIYGTAYSQNVSLSVTGYTGFQGAAFLDMEGISVIKEDTLPDGAAWTSADSLHLTFEVVADTVSKTPKRFMLKAKGKSGAADPEVACIIAS